MRIEHSDIRRFKRYDLPGILRSYGISLKKSGEGYLAACPFHEDSTPSLSINKNGEVWLWHCFGCNKGGTVIDFVMQKESLSFKEAYQRLQGLHIGEDACPAARECASTAVCEIPNRLKLLDSILRRYESGFRDSQRAQDYMKSRRLVSPEIYSRFRIGYSDGTLPRQAELADSLKSLGILTDSGYELFYDSVIFPIEDADGNIVSLYARRIDKKEHRYLKGPHEGAFNAKAFKASGRIYLTEGIIDALSLCEVGIYDSSALFGANVLTDDLLGYLRTNPVREVVLCLDNDDTGQRAIELIAKRLYDGLKVDTFRLNIPKEHKDLNEWLASGAMTKEAAEESVERISPMGSAGSIGQEMNREDALFQEYIDKKELNITFDDRRYRVRGLNLDDVSSLRANIKLTASSGSHMDTFDLASSQSRERFKKMARKLLDIDESLVHKDLNQMIERLESVQSKYLESRRGLKGSPVAILPGSMTDADRVEALSILRAPDLLERIVKDFHKAGYVGEDDNLLMGYLAATSRKMPSPLSLVLISRSSAGKTSLQDAILEFMPDEDVIKYTRLTGQALFYHEEDSLYKKVLAIEEEEGAMGAGYALRNILTSKYLRTGATIKDPQTGKLVSQTQKVRIQTSVFLTTTRQSLDYETLNRFIIATVDESEAQTKKILDYQRKLYGEDGHALRRSREVITALHKNIQRLLEPADIVNPYQQDLTFTSKTLRARREHMKYLNLINTIAFLRQRQKKPHIRPDGSSFIEVELKDIEEANRLAGMYLSKNLDDLSPTARNLYELIRKMAASSQDESQAFSRREIINYTGYSYWQVRTYLDELARLEYVIPANGRQGQRYLYKLTEDIAYKPLEADMGLTTPDETLRSLRNFAVEDAQSFLPYRPTVSCTG